MCLEQGRKYIYEKMDLSLIEKKLSHPSYLGFKWLKKDAKKGICLYKNFLFLTLKYYNMEKIIPSEEIDEVWHNHILDTRKYFEDCLHIFGEYLHHYPYFGIDTQSNLEDLNKHFQRSQDLYFLEFNEYY